MRRVRAMLSNVFSDVRYAFRSLKRSPAFTAVVVLTLALGIGANTAIFSVVRGVLLRPLPNRDGDRLVYLRHSMDAPGGANLSFSVPEVRDLRQGTTAFSGLAEYSPWSGILRADEGPVRLAVGLVTGNYFDVMGLRPVVGRLTDARDDGPSAAPVMILAYETWINRFAGDSGIVGKTVSFEKRPVEVIGVLQRAPFFPDRVDIFANMVNSEHHLSATMVEGRTHRMTEVVARLAPGASLAQAKAQVAAVDARMQNDDRASYDPASRYRIAVVPFKTAMGQDAKATLWLLMAAAAFVLVISCANVANLTLMRGVRREQELVTRAALGAGVGRLRRLLLAENLLLAGMGAVIGADMATGGVTLLSSFAARYTTRASEIRLDSGVLLFTLAISVTVALLLSVLASLPREGSLGSAILAGTQRTIGSLRKQRLQRGLVVVQIAVSVVLLAGAGLLTRTLVRLSEVDTGLKTEEILTMNVSAGLTRAERRDTALVEDLTARYQAMAHEIAALPGVTHVAYGSTPLRRQGTFFDVEAEGVPLASGEATPRAEVRAADPGYFDAAGIPLVAGRAFTGAESIDGDSSVIVNQVLADRFFRGQDPVGRRIRFTGDILRFTQGFGGNWRTIVGVARNAQDGWPDTDVWPEVFVPTRTGALVVRAGTHIDGLAGSVTRVVRQAMPTALIEHAETIAQYKDGTVAPQRLNAVLISSFGVLALIIAAVGIAGVLGFSVSTRIGEIGVRMSLGADAARVQRMILREGGVLLAVGLLLGVPGAALVARVMRGLLFGVSPDDPFTLAGVTGMMAAIGLVACWIPALRAARVDPAVTMRSS